ncbi:uncharacterized protein DS421_6g194440 [Arachis hypogaea]|nr:uncharacterized protein DS421_6g194440 [Arachis hypogaea]
MKLIANSIFERLPFCLLHSLSCSSITISTCFCSKRSLLCSSILFKTYINCDVVTVSPKRHNQLRVAQANNVVNLIFNDQIVTGNGLNQSGTLQRVENTR